MRTALLELYDFIVSYIIFTDWQRFFTPLRLLSASTSLLLVLVILTLVSKTRAKRKETGAAAAEKEEKENIDREKWQDITKRVQSQGENDYRMAVVEADKMFDDLIQKLGYRGADMGERLKKIKAETLPNIEDVWWAHKIRNRIVHESDFHLEHHQAKRAVDIYKEAMEKLEVL